MIDQMRAHVADRADAPIHPAAPIERMIDGVIRNIRSNAEEEIPREVFGNWVGAGDGRGQPGGHALTIPAESVGRFLERLGTRNALRPVTERPVGPNMHLADFANGAGLDVL